MFLSWIVLNWINAEEFIRIDLGLKIFGLIGDKIEVKHTNRNNGECGLHWIYCTYCFSAIWF